MGILIKGSNYLEALANTETVVFDKTGTLTEGIFEVQDIYAEGIEKDELLRIVAHAENYSNHPIAKSVKKAYNKEIDEKIIKNPQELSGKGIWAKIDEKDILVGNEKLMLEEKIDFKKCDEVGTILYVAIDKKYVGYVLIADKIKQDSPKTIRELKAMNIKETVMLTGDKKEVGEYVAKKLNMDKVYTELLPDGKAKKIEDLLNEKSKNGKVLFVGDGINDMTNMNNNNNNANTNTTNNTNNNDIMTGIGNDANTAVRNTTGYNATRTATDANTANFLGMNSTMWTWLIIAVAAAVIIALIWYYASSNNRRTNYYDDDNNH